MNKKIFYMINIIFLVTGLFANDLEYKGGYAGSFLRMGLGARNQSMGNSGVAMKNSNSGFYYNPALIAFEKNKSFTTGYSFLSLDRKFNHVGFTLPLPPSAAMSINWIHAGVDNIQGRSFAGYPTEKYDTGEDAVMLTFGNKLSEKLSFGFSLKYLRNSILNIEATGIGFDVGVYYQVLNTLSVGAQIKDINSSYNWKTTKLFEEQGSNYIEKFPREVKMGMMYNYNDFTFISDIVNFEGDYFIQGGMEYNYQKLASFRMGYDSNSFTFGFGLMYNFMWNTKTELNYAFIEEKYGEGHSHVFTWNFKI